MERPDHKSLSSLLEKHPLPWTAIREFNGTVVAHSYILDANNDPVMRIMTTIDTHKNVIDFLMFHIPEKGFELTT